MTVRAKFRLEEVHNVHWSQENKVLVFRAVCDDGIPENIRFAKYTPSGEFRMTVNGPALSHFELGKYYYFDASEVVEYDPNEIVASI